MAIVLVLLLTCASAESAAAESRFAQRAPPLVLPPRLAVVSSDIAFVAPNGDLWIGHPDGSGARSVASGPVLGPIVSHDGTHIAYLRKGSVAASSGEQAEIVNLDGSGRRVVLPRRPIPEFLQSGPQTSYQILGEVRWSYDDTVLYVQWNWGNISGKSISKIDLSTGDEEDLEIYAIEFEPLANELFAAVAYANACMSSPCQTGDFLSLATPHSHEAPRILVQPGDPFSYAPSPDGGLLAYTDGGALQVVTPDGESQGSWPIGPMTIQRWTADGHAVILGRDGGPPVTLSVKVPSADPMPGRSVAATRLGRALLPLSEFNLSSPEDEPSAQLTPDARLHTYDGFVEAAISDVSTAIAGTTCAMPLIELLPAAAVPGAGEIVGYLAITNLAMDPGCLDLYRAALAQVTGIPSDLLDQPGTFRELPE